jgi:hypothetical protein
MKMLPLGVVEWLTIFGTVMFTLLLLTEKVGVPSKSRSVAIIDGKKNRRERRLKKRKRRFITVQERAVSCISVCGLRVKLEGSGFYPEGEGQGLGKSLSGA